MYYKLSNTAERERLEKEFGASFRYPRLYRKQVLINGLAESNLPIITNKEPDKIHHAIWGLLPEYYQDDWGQFQDVANTLNIDRRDLDKELWYVEALRSRRCLVLVSGFFTSFMRNGILHPYFIDLKSGKPFVLAGVYNVLEDGFITCSILIKEANSYIRKFQNVVDTMPLILPKKYLDFWLNNEISQPELNHFLTIPHRCNLKATPIAKEFFNQNITYDSMLEPYAYDETHFDES